VIAVSLDGKALAGLIVVVFAAVVVIVFVSQLVARDRQVRVARFGWFVERQRFDVDTTEAEVWPKQEEEP